MGEPEIIESLFPDDGMSKNKYCHLGKNNYLIIKLLKPFEKIKVKKSFPSKELLDYCSVNRKGLRPVSRAAQKRQV